MARFDIISKDGNTIRYSGKPRYSGSYLKPSFLEFSEIAFPTPIAWEVGDYVDYPRTGMRYRLYSIPQPSKNARKGSYGGAFTYSNVQLHAATKELEIALFRDLVTNDNNIHFSTSPDVATYENVEGIARRIQACMDYFYPGRWEIRMAEFDAVADAEVIEKIATAKDFAMSGGTCLDALSKIYELWEEIGWVHTHENGKEVITIGYANKRIGANTTDVYLYGKGNGLTAIKKNQTNKDEFATRLYVYGSERNLPHRYYNGKDILNAESVDIRNLMLPLDKWGLTDGLPDARKAYLENAEAVAKYGVIPKTHYFDSDDAGADIYPSIEGMAVGQLRKVLADMGETKYSPNASIYPDDSERVDEIWASPRMVDDGVLKRNGKEHDIEIGWYQFATTTTGITIPKGTAEKAAVVENHLIKDLDIDSQGIIRAKITFTSDKICTLADAGYESVSGVLTLANSLDSPSIKEEMGFTFVLNDDGVWEGRLPKVIANYDKQSYVRYVAFASLSVYVTPKQALASDVTASVNISDGYVTFIADQLFDKTFQLTLKQIGFDINERAAMGEGKVISMKTGMCAGRNFVISECRYVANTDKWVLTCRRQQDDTLGMLFPNKDYQIALGDRFVLLDIALPEVYIGVAQERLLAEGEKLLAKASRIQNHYEPMIDAKVMIESGRTLREGMFMEISDEDVIDNGTDYILIDSLSIYEDESAIPTYKVILREKKKVTYKGTPSATSETSTKSYGEGETANVDIDLSDYATKDYVDNAIGGITPGGDSVEVEGSEFIKVTDGKVELELDSQGGLGNAGQGLGIVEIPQGLLSEYAKKSDLEGISIDVDSAMSDTSTNAVANKVIKEYVDQRAEQAYGRANEYTNEEIASLRGEIANSNGARAIELQAEWLDGQPHSFGMTWEEYIATPYVVFTFPSHDGENLRFERVALCDRTTNFTDIYVETQIGSSETAIVAEVFKSGSDAVIKFIDDIKALPRFLPTTDNADSKFLNAKGEWMEMQTDVDHPVFEFTFDTTTNKATAEMVSALAEAISENKLILCNGRTYKFILEDGGMYGLVSDAYMDITDGKLKASVLAVMSSSYDVQLMEEEVPVGTEITEETVRGWGFTKNAGTITGIKMNGATVGTSGVVDLGNVLTEHQKLKTVNGQSLVGEGDIIIQGGGGATPRVEMTAASAAIEPNKFYIWPMMDSLDVSLGAEQGGVMNKYFFQFRNPKAGVTMLTLPDTITWSEDTELDENGMPVMEAAAFYRIEIIEGLASLKKWKLVYINFADAEVERALMSKGIGDGIGITKRDAKSVTSIGAIFVNNEVVESFEEFEFFTGITAITGSAWEDGGFRGCANLKKIKLPKSLQTIFAGAIPGKYSSTGAFKDCISLEEITIPTGVDTIPTSAFYNCKSLVAVHFDGTVKAFDQYAFAECINLVIEIPSSVEHIDERAFLNVPMKGIVVDCPNLKYLSGRYVFTRSKIRGVESLGNITELRFQSDPPGYYGNYPTFYGCADMEFINLPDTLTHIGRNMFQGCSALRSVTIPHGVGELFTGTFAGCYNLEWMKVEAVTPPALYTLDCIDMGSDYPIYVPNASVEAYKGATNWNSYAHRIRGLQDFILGIVTPQSIRCSSSILTAENAVGEKVWSIVGGSEFATITEDGILTILPNASDAEVTIRCTDNNGNIAEKMINVTYNAPLMYLPFDEDFVDAMGNASLLNAVECSIDESKGVIGASMNRPYTAGGLSYQPSFNASFADKSFSVDVWVYLPSNAPNTYLGIAGKRTNASLGASWSFGIKDRKVNIGLSANGGGFTNDFYTDAVIPLEKWTRVTMVRDYGRGEYRVYVDTKLVATFGANYALYNGSDGLAVGNYHTDPSNDYFYGNLDEFRIYEGCIFD